MSEIGIKSRSNEELIRAYQKGEAGALDEIVLANQGIVRMIANKFYSSKIASISEEDLIQEGYIGLITAANKYNLDNERKATFITYAVYWIRAKISRYISNKKNALNEISLSVPTGDDVEFGDTLKEETDYICNVEESIWYADLKAEIRGAMKETLTLRERQAIELRYGFDYGEPIPAEIHISGYGVHTFGSVGEVLGITEQVVRQLEQSSLKKLRVSSFGKRIAAEKDKTKEIRGYSSKKAWESYVLDRVKKEHNNSSEALRKAEYCGKRRKPNKHILERLEGIL